MKDTLIDGQFLHKGKNLHQKHFFSKLHWLVLFLRPVIISRLYFTGEMLNIDDAYENPLFYRRIDETTGFRTRYSEEQ